MASSVAMHFQVPLSELASTVGGCNCSFSSCWWGKSNVTYTDIGRVLLCVYFNLSGGFSTHHWHKQPSPQWPQGQPMGCLMQRAETPAPEHWDSFPEDGWSTSIISDQGWEEACVYLPTANAAQPLMLC